MHWIFNFDNGRSPCRVNHASAAVGHFIFSFGGYCQQLKLRALKEKTPIEVHVLNTLTCRWSKRDEPKQDEAQYAATPYFRYGHTCVTYENMIYLFGGRADWPDVLDNQIYKYNPKLHSWSILEVGGSVPPGRDGHSACVINGNMLIFGGYVEIAQKFSNDINEFNFKSQTWSLIIPKSDVKPHWRDFHSATAIGTKMYVFGGRSDQGQEIFTGNSVYYNDLYAFDVKTSKWEKIHGEYNEEEAEQHGDNTDSHTPPCGRRSHSALAYHNKIYTFGGFQENSKTHFNDLFEFDTESLKWTKIVAKGVVPSQRRRHSCCIIDDRMFIFGGTGPGDRTKSGSHEAHRQNNREREESLIAGLNNFLQNLEPFFQQYGLNLNDHYIRRHHINQNNNTLVIRTVFNLISTISRQLRPNRQNNAAQAGAANNQPEQENDAMDEEDDLLNFEPPLLFQPTSNDNQVNAGAGAAEHVTAQDAPAAVEEDHDANMADAEHNLFHDLLNEFDENEHALSESDDQEMLDEEDLDDDGDESQDLISYSDLHILELKIPSLATLCMIEVINKNLDYSGMPKYIREELTNYRKSV